MSRVEAVRVRLDLGRTELQNALEIASVRWDDLVFLEDPGSPIPGQRSAWSARDIAEHALSVDQLNFEAAVRTVRDHTPVDLFTEMRTLTDFDWENRSFQWLTFATSKEAIDELARRGTERNPFLEELGEDALDYPAGMSPGALAYLAARAGSAPNTVEGILLFCAEHFLDHAEQLRGVQTTFSVVR